jgi:flagellar biosynthesis protein FlhA
VLLISTMLRLSLNMASTRLILSHGHEGTAAAGHVIEAFGNFVMSVISSSELSCSRSS